MPLALRSPALRLALAAIAIGALLAWPLRHASPFLDDYGFLAIGRHIDNPLVLLVQDSTGAYFFRPLVMFLWWATALALGDSAPAQLAFNVGVHVANALVLYALLRAFALSSGAAAIGALVFVAHPTAFAACAWLSDRFDLFATGFGLAALIAVERYLLAPRRALAVAVVLATLASLASKEIGFAPLAAAFGLVAWRDVRHRATPRERAVLGVVLAGCAVAALAARFAVLRFAQQQAFFEQGVITTLAEGAWKWMRALPGFLVVAHGNALGIAAWVAALACGLALALVAASRRRMLEGGIARAVACAVALMLCAAALQSPVALAMLLPPFAPDHFEFGALAASRLYYLPLAGFAMLVGVAAESIASAATPRVKAGMAALFVAALAGLVASSRSIGREWDQYTSERGVFARAAAEAIVARNDLGPGCKIYFLDVPELGRDFPPVADVAVKAALPRRHAALGCFIQSQRSPWYNLLATHGLEPGSERPLQTILVDGRAFEPLRVSNLAFYYLEIPEGAQAIDDPRALFFAYEGGHFVDVTAEVRARQRAVRFRQERPSR